MKKLMFAASALTAAALVGFTLPGHAPHSSAVGAEEPRSTASALPLSEVTAEAAPARSPQAPVIAARSAPHMPRSVARATTKPTRAAAQASRRPAHSLATRAPAQDAPRETPTLAALEPTPAPAATLPEAPARRTLTAVPRPSMGEIRENWRQHKAGPSFDPRREKTSYRACDLRDCAIDPDKSILVAGVVWRTGERARSLAPRGDLRRGDFRQGTPAVYME